MGYEEDFIRILGIRRIMQIRSEVGTLLEQVLKNAEYYSRRGSLVRSSNTRQVARELV